MSPYDNAGRIPKIRFIIASVTLFTLAILFTFCRVIIRLRYQTGRLSLDDAFLAFGVLCLCVSFALLFAFLSSMFVVEAVISGYPNPDISLDLVDQRLQFHVLISIFLVLTHTTIFAVKFSYLFFFKCLIRRVRKLNIYWWTVTLMTGAVWGFGVVDVFLLCHFFDMARNASCISKPNNARIIGWVAAITALDVITDVLIIAIPIQLLWRVQIKLGRKLVLGASLCLSVMMINASLVRISAIHAPPHGFFDLNWQVFWMLSEACIAVMMFSLTGFRSFFLAHAPTVGKSSKKVPLHFSIGKILEPKQLWTGRARTDSEEMEAPPDIPRATLTENETYGEPTVSSQIEDELEDGEGSRKGRRQGALEIFVLMMMNIAIF